jgi:hypothetical protein
MEREVDLLLDGVLSDLVKEEGYLLVQLIKKDMLHVMDVVGIKKVLAVLVQLMQLLLLVLLIDASFPVYILLRMEDVVKSTHGLDLRVVLWISCCWKRVIFCVFWCFTR